LVPRLGPQGRDEHPCFVPRFAHSRHPRSMAQRQFDARIRLMGRDRRVAKKTGSEAEKSTCCDAPGVTCVTVEGSDALARVAFNRLEESGQPRRASSS
jgi:hypothetical protein